MAPPLHLLKLKYTPLVKLRITRETPTNNLVKSQLARYTKPYFKYFSTTNYFNSNPSENSTCEKATSDSPNASCEQINGKDSEPLIKLPPFPEPPPPDLCCMSGCAVCVLDVYGQELDAYLAAREKLKEQLISRNIPIPPELEVKISNPYSVP
ncbi:hypothetical protein DSO57_1016165 [Entomophthora muscae]|uniref:Uncharacterized protein n=1 Tax=Entomophthora muscae TaxID=34485 RepID=A0ACC2STN3_9FUNG|nr:hypothetical protein DSO57_1016165 [Entomophthora muscae]